MTENMLRPEPKPIIVEYADIGKEVLKFTFATPEEFAQWWTGEGSYEIPLYGSEALGQDF